MLEAILTVIVAALVIDRLASVVRMHWPRYRITIGYDEETGSLTFAKNGRRIG